MTQVIVTEVNTTVEIVEPAGHTVTVSGGPSSIVVVDGETTVEVEGPVIHAVTVSEDAVVVEVEETTETVEIQTGVAEIIHHENGYLDSPVVSQTTIVLSAAYAFDIESATVRCGSGTCTFSMSIQGGGGVWITGIYLRAATTTKQVFTATANNRVEVGYEVTVNLQNVDCFGLAWTIKTRRV
jgi:hypothetical protein